MKMKYICAGVLLAAAVGISAVRGLRWADQRLLSLPESETLRSLIEYIRKEGVPAVDKYEN